MSTDKFTATRVAIKAWDDHAATFDDMLNQTEDRGCIDPNATVNAWFAEQDRLQLEVGKEFVKVTPNSADNASLVRIQWAKEMSAYSSRADLPLAKQRSNYICRVMGEHKISGIPMTEEKAGKNFDTVRGR